MKDGSDNLPITYLYETCNYMGERVNWLVLARSDISIYVTYIIHIVLWY